VLEILGWEFSIPFLCTAETLNSSEAGRAFLCRGQGPGTSHCRETEVSPGGPVQSFGVSLLPSYSEILKFRCHIRSSSLGSQPNHVVNHPHSPSFSTESNFRSCSWEQDHTVLGWLQAPRSSLWNHSAFHQGRSEWALVGRVKWF
jgi:hypothetical protein